MTIAPECAPPVNLVLPRQSSFRERFHLTSVPDIEPPTPSLNPVILNSWQTQVGTDLRDHQLQRLTLPRRHHLMLHTDAADSQANDLAIALLPGWTETIHGKNLEDTHAGLSHQLPEASIDTHATYGTDGTLPHYNPFELGKQTVEYATHKTLDVFERLYEGGRAELEATALGAAVLARIELLNRFDGTLYQHDPLEVGEQAIHYAARKTFDVFVPLYEGKRTVIVATSMSAAVLARMEQLNQSAGEPLDIAGCILYEPCLVLPENAGAGLLGRFAVHLVQSAFDELVHHSSPRVALGLIYDSLHSHPPVADLPVIGRLGFSLLQGTSAGLLETLAEQHPYLIQGVEDCLRNTSLEEDPRVTTKLVPSKGHCMNINSGKRVTAITAAVMAMGLRPTRPL
jgi:hypothetical protein